MFLKEEFPWGKALGRARERLTRGTAGEVILLWPPAPTRTISPSPTCPLTRGYGFIQGHTAKKPSCRALNASFTACWELVSNQGQHRFLRHNLSILGAPPHCKSSHVNVCHLGTRKDCAATPAFGEQPWKAAHGAASLLPTANRLRYS